MVDPIVTTECNAELREEGLSLLAVLRGAADFSVRGEFERFISQLHDEALGRGAPQVTVDLRDLAFMGGSGIKVMARWLARVGEAGNPYRIVLRSDVTRPWQVRSLAALTCIPGSYVTIET